MAMPARRSAAALVLPACHARRRIQLMARETVAARRLALFMPSLRGGGAEKVMLTLAAGFAARGHSVDLVVAQKEGPYLSQVPAAVRLVDLRARRVLTALPGLVHYIRRESPVTMLSALSHANVVAIWARSMARTDMRLVVSEHNTPSFWLDHVGQRRARLLPRLMRATYGRADHVVAVSAGLAAELAATLAIDANRISLAYNPVVTPRLSALAAQPLDHPWFAPGRPPVVLSAGRLTDEKDFGTLIEAFARVRRERAARLVILGEGPERASLQGQLERLGLAEDVLLPGFVDNPFQYMRRAAVFVLSSRCEGFGNVLVEAMACATPVISTDCPNGPREILEDGRHGVLVTTGDAAMMATAILRQIDRPAPDSALERARSFSVDAALDRYTVALGI
jgi:glycosyltransferase involved in cell wall biosynthesis